MYKNTIDVSETDAKVKGSLDKDYESNITSTLS